MILLPEKLGAFRWSMSITGVAWVHLRPSESLRVPVQVLIPKANLSTDY